MKKVIESEKKSKVFKTVFDITITAMFIAVIVVSAQISFPLPSGVPVTLQTFAVALCGYCLGVKRSSFALLGYLLMGVVGIPVFSAFSGGIGVLLGKTGGFIFGFIFLVFSCGLVSDNKKIFIKIGSGIIGLVLCHLIGVLYFAHLTGSDFVPALLLVSLPYAVKDIISVAGAALISGRISSLIKKASSIK